MISIHVCVWGFFDNFGWVSRLRAALFRGVSRLRVGVSFTFQTLRATGRSSGFGGCRHLAPVCMPTKVRTRMGGEFGLWLPSDPSLAPVRSLP
jgi:hypothetical protein